MRAAGGVSVAGTTVGRAGAESAAAAPAARKSGSRNSGTEALRSSGWMIAVSPGRVRVCGSTRRGTTTAAPHSPQNMAPAGNTVPQLLQFTGSPPDDPDPVVPASYSLNPVDRCAASRDHLVPQYQESAGRPVL